MHSRAPCDAHRAVALAKPSACVQPPMPAAEVAHTPRVASCVQPCMCGSEQGLTERKAAGGLGGKNGDGGGCRGIGAGAIGGCSGGTAAASAQHRTACVAVAFISQTCCDGLPPNAAIVPAAVESA